MLSKIVVTEPLHLANQNYFAPAVWSCSFLSAICRKYDQKPKGKKQNWKMCFRGSEGSYTNAWTFLGQPWFRCQKPFGNRFRASRLEIDDAYFQVDVARSLLPEWEEWLQINESFKYICDHSKEGVFIFQVQDCTSNGLKETWKLSLLSSSY